MEMLVADDSQGGGSGQRRRGGGSRRRWLGFGHGGSRAWSALGLPTPPYIGDQGP
jgi:hypothetical protein